MKTLRKAKRHTRIKPTLLECLNRLPEPYKSKSISYAKESDLNKPIHKSNKTLADALFSAFIFSEAPEGGDYWYSFYQSLNFDI